MRKTLRGALALLSLLASAGSAAPDKEKLQHAVAAMEGAFCAMAGGKGLLAAFQHFAAPDVAFIDTDPAAFAVPPLCSNAWAPTSPA